MNATPEIIKEIESLGCKCSVDIAYTENDRITCVIGYNWIGFHEAVERIKQIYRILDKYFVYDYKVWEPFKKYIVLDVLITKNKTEVKADV